MNRPRTRTLSMTTLILLAALLSLAPLLLLVAREKTGQTRAEGPPENYATGNGQSAVVDAGVGGKEATVDVLLLPHPLKSLDTVQARVTGCGGVIHYAWEVNDQPLAGVATESLSSVNFLRNDTVTAIVFCDDIEKQVSATVTNSPPRIHSVNIFDHNETSGRKIELVPNTFDSDGDDVQYVVEWRIDGEVLDFEDQLILPGDYVQKGQEVQVRISPRDPYAKGQVYRSLAFVVPNGVPHFYTKPPAKFSSLDYTYLAGATDPDGESLNYRLDEAPPGMTIDSNTGKLAWQMDPGKTGKFLVRIVAQDPEGASAEQSFTLTLVL
jgi:hypothetical protein